MGKLWPLTLVEGLEAGRAARQGKKSPKCTESVREEMSCSIHLLSLAASKVPETSVKPVAAPKPRQPQDDSDSEVSSSEDESADDDDSDDDADDDDGLTIVPINSLEQEESPETIAYRDHQRKLDEFYALLQDEQLRTALGKLLSIAVCPYLAYLVHCAMHNIKPELQKDKEKERRQKSVYSDSMVMTGADGQKIRQERREADELAEQKRQEKAAATAKSKAELEQERAEIDARKAERAKKKAENDARKAGLEQQQPSTADAGKKSGRGRKPKAHPAQEQHSEALDEDKKRQVRGALLPFKDMLRCSKGYV